MMDFRCFLPGTYRLGSDKDWLSYEQTKVIDWLTDNQIISFHYKWLLFLLYEDSAAI